MLFSPLETAQLCHCAGTSGGHKVASVQEQSRLHELGMLGWNREQENSVNLEAREDFSGRGPMVQGPEV